MPCPSLDGAGCGPPVTRPSLNCFASCKPAMSSWSKAHAASASAPSWSGYARSRSGQKHDRMLYPLFFPLADQFQAFNLFRYITFRSGGAAVTALLISFLFGPHIIAWLRSKQTNGQPIRSDGPEGHLLRKKGTPTMGGFLILLALTIATLLWADLANSYVWIALLVTVGFGLIGFFDDYKKLTSNSHRGLSASTKIALEIGVGALACIALGHVTPAPLANTLAVPFFKNVLINLDGLF